MGMPVAFQEITSTDLQDPALQNLNTLLRQLVQMINYLSGFNGTIALSADLDMQKHNIHNLGTPSADGDALCKTSADPLYGAAVQTKNMSAVGNNILATTRQLNNPNQREQSSSFLNDTFSTPPGSNAANVTFTTIDPTHTQINVSANTASLADKSVIPFAARSDQVTNPTSYTIDTLANSGAVRNNGVVTIKTTTSHGFSPGQFASISVTGDPSFNGNFIVTSVPDATHFTYAQSGPNTTNGGGTASLGGVYYYYLRKSDNTLQMTGPFSTDTAANRINANLDGRQFIAVATVTGSGGSGSNSGGGGDSINQGGCTEIGTRLESPAGCEFTVDVVPCNVFVDLVTKDGVKLSCARDTLVSVFIRVQDLEHGMLIEGADGTIHPLLEKRTETRQSYKQVVRVKPQGTYLANGIRLHNIKTA